MSPPAVNHVVETGDVIRYSSSNTNVSPGAQILEADARVGGVPFQPYVLVTCSPFFKLLALVALVAVASILNSRDAVALLPSSATDSLTAAAAAREKCSTCIITISPRDLETALNVSLEDTCVLESAEIGSDDPNLRLRHTVSLLQSMILPMGVS